MNSDQQKLHDCATPLKPVLGGLVGMNSFSAYDRVPTFLRHASEEPGVFICTACNPPVYYRNKMTALNDDEHAKDPVWLKRYHMWNDDVEDPWVWQWLTAEQREKGLRPANHHD
ncbi:hypothetical protein [Halorarum salinum]|uniref:Uncharacterized protein n=1 Tax=Halorarum salinum TaxID=2743089 RepID=A0A7D5LAQ0_9EURY|nr:hypothetical protein [Halobaculum salinum]QLG62010.1 hypothetical protein HUG12_09855 [Halobaculum salinum]